MYQRIHIVFNQADFVEMRPVEGGKVRLVLCGKGDVDVKYTPNLLVKLELKAFTNRKGETVDCHAFFGEQSCALEVELFTLLDQMDQHGDLSFVALKKAGVTEIESLVVKANSVLRALGVKQSLKIEKRRVRIV